MDVRFYVHFFSMAGHHSPLMTYSDEHLNRTVTKSRARRPKVNDVLNSISRAKMRSVQQMVVIVLTYVASSTPFICAQLWLAWGSPSSAVCEFWPLSHHAWPKCDYWHKSAWGLGIHQGRQTQWHTTVMQQGVQEISGLFTAFRFEMSTYFFEHPVNQVFSSKFHGLAVLALDTK